MNTKQKNTFDPTAAAMLIPGQVKLQRDCMGRPIKVGDRVDDTTFYVGGIVVSVFGEACIFLTDYDGDYGIGRFCWQACKELRLLPPVMNLKRFVKDTLAFRAKVDKVGGPIPKDSERREMLACQCTRIRPELCKDARGKRVEIGDTLAGTDDVISSGFPAAGIVVGIAGDAVLIQTADDIGPGFEGVPAARYVVVPKGGAA